MNIDELIKRAESVIKFKKVGDRVFGDVGAALVTDKGNVYLGVAMDTASTGVCAEHVAIGAMVTGGEYKIKQIVAVWRKEEEILCVLPPCGKCREIMRQTDESNLGAEVILGKERVVRLRELLPYYEWPVPLE